MEFFRVANDVNRCADRRGLDGEGGWFLGIETLWCTKKGEVGFLAISFIFASVERRHERAFDEVIFPLGKLAIVNVRQARLNDKDAFDGVLGAM